jgi:dTDP-4-dehydrorhamnose 3,5-epimerase
VRVECEPTMLEGLMLVRHGSHQDARGSFHRLFDAADVPGFRAEGAVQANWSVTRETGTVRGMHFQAPPHSEAKVVTCLQGEVFDIAIDLRPGSTTLGQWHAERLTPDAGVSLLIPAGFAHGFQALRPDTQLLYLHSTWHAAEAERGVNPLDPRLAIPWPLPVRNLSKRDASFTPLPPGLIGVLA